MNFKTKLVLLHYATAVVARAHRRGQRVRGSTVVRVGEPSMKAWYMPNAPAHAVTFEVAHLVIVVLIDTY